MGDDRQRLVHLAVLTPREGRAEDVLASMRVMGGPADRHPRLRQHLIGRDRQTGRLIGVTVWDSEDDWNEAVTDGRAAMAGSDFDMDAILEDGDVFVLDVVDLVDPAAGVDSRGTLPER
jgi:hypothetical protein